MAHRGKNGAIIGIEELRARIREARGNGGQPESVSEIEFVQRRINEMRFISDS